MHVNWKWGPFHFTAGLDATKFVFLCVFTVIDTDLLKNLGKTTIQNWEKNTSYWCELLNIVFA